jgi:hypothetical protein
MPFHYRRLRFLSLSAPPLRLAPRVGVVRRGQIHRIPCAKVVFTVLASMPIDWTHPLTYVCGGRVLEWPCAGVTCRVRQSVDLRKQSLDQS